MQSWEGLEVYGRGRLKDVHAHDEQWPAELGSQSCWRNEAKAPETMLSCCECGQTLSTWNWHHAGQQFEVDGSQIGGEIVQHCERKEGTKHR